MQLKRIESKKKKKYHLCCWQTMKLPFPSKDVARQASVLALLGGSAYALRYVPFKKRSDVPDCIKSTEYLSSQYPSLVKHLQSFRRVDEDDLFETLVRCIESVLCTVNSDSSQEEMNTRCIRLNHGILRVSEVLNDFERRMRRNRRLNIEYIVQCVEEDRPAIDGIMDALLHNFMLDASPTCI